MIGRGWLKANKGSDKIRNYETHEDTMRKLNSKKRIAEMKCEERKLKIEILKLMFPFKFNLKFNKIIVLVCIAAIVSYTIAAILLQKYTMVELSPTLTTCVYAFFGTELIGLAGIKIMDTKTYNVIDNCNAEFSSDDSDAVG